jgi:hypothetical protein
MTYVVPHYTTKQSHQSSRAGTSTVVWSHYSKEGKGINTEDPGVHDCFNLKNYPLLFTQINRCLTPYVKLFALF